MKMNLKCNLFLHLVDFHDNEQIYQPFSQRPLAMKTEEVELSGKVE